MQKIRVGINGFGRIGRQVFRALHVRYKDQVEVVAINDLFDAETNFHLLEYDTNYGRAYLDAHIEGDNAIVGDWNIHCFAERDPKPLPGVPTALMLWSNRPASSALPSRHRCISTTAPKRSSSPLRRKKKTSPSSWASTTRHTIPRSTISFPTPLAPPIALPPVALILEREFGIATGTMTTIHAYTNDQRILDLPHKDLRRARAAACNIIPSSTGAAQAVAKVIPSLKGKFTGWSLRVPTPTVSVVDFTAILNKETDTDTLRAALKTAAEGELKGILAYSDAPLVSMDFKGDPHSSIVEAEYTTVQDGKLAKIVSWYDNEWGYSNRVADLILW